MQFVARRPLCPAARVLRRRLRLGVSSDSWYVVIVAAGERGTGRVLVAEATQADDLAAVIARLVDWAREHVALVRLDHTVMPYICGVTTTTE